MTAGASSPTGWRGRNNRRAITVAAAVAAAVVAYWLATGPAGVDLRTPESPGSETLRDLPLAVVIAVTLGAGLLAWVAAIVVERFVAARARVIWTVLAAAVLAVSFGPVTALDVDGNVKTWLAILHVVVAAPLIVGFLPTFTRGRARPPGPPFE